MRNKSLFASLLVLSFAGALRAENSPAYDSWATHQPGTSVVVKKVMEANGHKTEMEVTYTLTAVASDKVTVDQKMAMTVGSQHIEMPSRPIDIPAVVSSKFSGEFPGQKSMPDNGTVTRTSEDVTLDGKTYKCTLIEYTGESNGIKIHAKSWNSKEVPMLVVKMESQTEGRQVSNSTQTLEKVDIK